MKQLVGGQLSAGQHSVIWNGTELALVKFDPEFPEIAKRILLD